MAKNCPNIIFSFINEFIAGLIYIDFGSTNAHLQKGSSMAGRVQLVDFMMKFLLYI